ncbi:hypothetical protein AAFC00_000653 [Neodothiora populina]
MSTTGTLSFIPRDELYQREKPYTLKFNPPTNLAKSNIKGLIQDVTLEDVRGRKDRFTIEDNGFEIVVLPETLAYHDFEDETKIKQVYLPQIAQLLMDMLGASRVQIFEHLVRRRHISFPIATGEVYQHYQPTTTAHIDMTQGWARKMAGRLNHRSGIHELPSQSYQFVNVWKPLRGPIQDWPLALCNPATVSEDSTIAGDIVFEDMEMENTLLHYDNEQKWYYLSDQKPDEAWIFVQGDNRSGIEHKCVPHTSFSHRDYTGGSLPRESIEVRALVFYDT